MFRSVAMPPNAQTTVDAAGDGDANLLWLWVSSLNMAPALGFVGDGIAFAFSKRVV